MKNASLGIVTNTRQEILLVLRKDVPFWVLPGGGIETGESMESACLREVLEETGLCMTSPFHIATYFPINALASTTYVYGGVCPQTYALQAQTSEVLEARFFSFETLPENLFFVHRHLLEDWKNAKALPFSRPLTEVTYTRALCFLIKHPILSLRYLWTRLKLDF